jgi:hypothetical protein
VVVVVGRLHITGGTVGVVEPVKIAVDIQHGRIAAIADPRVPLGKCPST